MDEQAVLIGKLGGLGGVGIADGADLEISRVGQERLGDVGAETEADEADIQSAVFHDEAEDI